MRFWNYHGFNNPALPDCKAIKGAVSRETTIENTGKWKGEWEVQGSTKG